MRQSYTDILIYLKVVLGEERKAFVKDRPPFKKPQSIEDMPRETEQEVGRQSRRVD